MKTYIALLRGINVSGQKSIRMGDLRALLEKKGFHKVRTYIQSGNIVLASKAGTAGSIAQKIGLEIQKAYGFDVLVLVKSIADFERILQENPWKDSPTMEDKRLYFVLLKDPPRQALIERLEQETYPNEQFRITKECVYLTCLKGYGQAKLDNNLLEKKLGVRATTRNLRTMQKLLEMAMTD